MTAVSLVLSALSWGSVLATTKAAQNQLDKTQGQIARFMLGISKRNTCTSGYACMMELFGTPMSVIARIRAATLVRWYAGNDVENLAYQPLGVACRTLPPRDDPRSSLCPLTAILLDAEDIEKQHGSLSIADLTSELTARQSDETTKRMVRWGLFETSPVLRRIQGTTWVDNLGILLLMRTRLGAERGNLAPQVAGRRLINMAHRAGCPCCKKSADEMPGGETDEHRLIECEAFAEARRQTGLQAIIDELKETELIKAFPPDSRLTAMYILLIGGHVTTPQRLVQPGTQAAQVRIATWGDAQGGVYWKAAHFLARIHKPHRTAIDALRKEYKEARYAARDQQCLQCGDADCNQKERAMLLCDGKGGTCNKSYHIGCLTPPLSATPPAENDWFCPECMEEAAQDSDDDEGGPQRDAEAEPPRARHADTGGDRYYGHETLEDGMHVDIGWLESYDSRVDPRDLDMPHGVDSTGAQEEELGGDAPRRSWRHTAHRTTRTTTTTTPAAKTAPKPTMKTDSEGGATRKTARGGGRRESGERASACKRCGV